jgi:hypothetical protein
MKKSSHLYDQHNQIYVKLINKDNGWERHISIDKKTWKLTHKDLSMTEALTIKQDVINNNFKNLFKKILKNE